MEWKTFLASISREPIGDDGDMNAKTQRSRGGTAIIFLKRFFPALILMCTCVFPPPLFSAETGKSGVGEKTAGKTVETIAEKAAEKVEQTELKTTRPDAFKGPTTVHFMVFVSDIHSIDAAAQSFAANVFLRLRWKDTRLANPGEAVREIPLVEVWNPRILLANQRARISKSLPEVVQVHPDGMVLLSPRLHGKAVSTADAG